MLILKFSTFSNEKTKNVDFQLLISSNFSLFSPFFSGKMEKGTKSGKGVGGRRQSRKNKKHLYFCFSRTSKKSENLTIYQKAHLLLFDQLYSELNKHLLSLPWFILSHDICLLPRTCSFNPQNSFPHKKHEGASISPSKIRLRISCFPNLVPRSRAHFTLLFSWLFFASLSSAACHTSPGAPWPANWQDSQNLSWKTKLGPFPHQLQTLPSPLLPHYPMWTP